MSIFYQQRMLATRLAKLSGVSILAFAMATSAQSATDADAILDVADSESVPLNAVSPDTLKTFVSVIDLVRKEYYEPISDEQLFEDAIAGMLKRVDSHAEFLDAQSYENLRAFTEGELAQVGMNVVYQPQQNAWVVTDVAKGSSADKANIKIKDYIHQINDIELDDTLTQQHVDQLLKGFAGSLVDIVVSHQGRQQRNVTLQRMEIEQTAVKVDYTEGMAVIKIPVFQTSTRQEILDGLADIDKPIYGVLLDMRDNPGGVLDSAVDVASLIQPTGIIVQVKDRYGVQEVIESVGAEEGTSILQDIPVVILQNRFSASASEVLASSLKSHQLATIVGEASYGKGSIQSVVSLDDDRAVKLTVAHYLTADGQDIDELGVQADTVFDEDNATGWLEEALTVLKDKTSNKRYLIPSELAL